MSGEPLFQSRVDWTDWALHAEPRTCEGCARVFQPNHPRRRFCNEQGCPGRKPPPPRVKVPARVSGRAQAAARTAQLQGFLAQVLVATNGLEDGTLGPVLIAAGELVAAERAGASGSVLSGLLVALCAAAASRNAILMPPRLEVDEPG